MTKKFEQSSGGIVYRIKNGKIEILLLQRLNSRKAKELVIPKGHIEEGEVAKDTAIREIKEEAGLDPKKLEVIKFITKLNYTFTAGYLQNSPVIDKDVYLFLIKYHGHKDPVVQKEERFIGFQWQEIDTIKDLNIRFDLNGIISRNRTYFI